MTTANPTVKSVLAKQDYSLTITDILVKYICSKEFHDLEPETRHRVAGHVWRCYEGVWA